MSKRTHVRLTSVVLAIMLLLNVTALLLAFYVPKLVAIWRDTGQTFATWQVWLAYISDYFAHQGLAVMLVLAAGFVATYIWRIAAKMRLMRAVEVDDSDEGASATH